MFNRIAMIGLGDIGLPTATLFTAREKQVVGVDLSHHTVDTINAGGIQIVEPEQDMLVYAPVNQGYRRATTPEPAEAFLIAAMRDLQLLYPPPHNPAKIKNFSTSRPPPVGPTPSRASVTLNVHLHQPQGRKIGGPETQPPSKKVIVPCAQAEQTKPSATTRSPTPTSPPRQAAAPDPQRQTPSATSSRKTSCSPASATAASAIAPSSGGTGSAPLSRP